MWIEKTEKRSIRLGNDTQNRCDRILIFQDFHSGILRMQMIFDSKSISEIFVYGFSNWYSMIYVIFWAHVIYPMISGFSPTCDRIYCGLIYSSPYYLACISYIRSYSDIVTKLLIITLRSATKTNTKSIFCIWDWSSNNLDMKTKNKKC